MKDRIIKTVVPYLVGLLIALATTYGIDIDQATKDAFTQVLTFVFGTAYYVIVVGLAKKFPWAEKLLGSSKKPEYEA